MNLSHLPLRVAIGAFVLNSGLSKWTLEGEPAAALHGMAAGAMPPVKRIGPDRFAKLIASTEIALGTALLVPVVPSALVGAGLVGFGGGLLRLYLATPGLREPGSVRPTQQGVPIAKDSWLVGAGLTLLLDDLFGRMSSKRRGMSMHLARNCRKRRT
ncbi:DoxX family membrane protein [Plantactinospora sp. S1510]|uniref:DoxX family membrane protein n=1 Tax=Plantactinospora alkalitolerans TaxID=2789879 RepID=A0ABS0H721_9ACTN|nr:DoxX family membrane protein [Plantactinospora alkalitolerans]MBF9133944.1 DoxX family membrane protein [Plantactinospora alkalitolerans]